jgi:hypothetical protein
MRNGENWDQNQKNQAKDARGKKGVEPRKTIDERRGGGGGYEFQ